MLSPADLAVAGVVALILFGPDKLPGFARQIGKVTREVQATGQSFIREIERAGEEPLAVAEARRIREQGMNPDRFDYAETIANRPPRTSDEPLYDPIVHDPVDPAVTAEPTKTAEMRASRPSAEEDDLRD